jgi:hypothetical protein
MTTTDHPTRRDAFRSAMIPGAVAALALTAAAIPAARAQSPADAPLPNGWADADVLNFALNLEYLEAEYYLRGVTGRGLDEALGGGLGGSVRGGRQVTFANPRHGQFLADVAKNELAHVQFLRAILQNRAVPRPAIDLDGGFAAVAQAAGMPGFDPFADATSYFLGAFLFEDVGVTAYKGAASMIRDSGVLQSAAGILATEAYHAGMIRGVVYKAGPRAIDMSTRIAQLRDRLDGPAPSDAPVVVNGRAHISPADESGIAVGRMPGQVLNIVYGNPARGVGQGAFFPQGMNGAIRVT